MARSSLSDVQGSIIDPAQTWNFDLFFEKLPAGSSPRKRGCFCTTSTRPRCSRVFPA